jgi:hypothetical protein
MSAETDSFSWDRYFSFRIFKVVVIQIGVLFHEVFDVIEVLVDLVEAVEP